MQPTDESCPGDQTGASSHIPNDQQAPNRVSDNSITPRDGDCPPGVHWMDWNGYIFRLLNAEQTAAFERKLNPPPPRPTLPSSEVAAGRRRSYALNGLSKELRVLAETTEASHRRNTQLNESAFKVARFVRDGLLSRDEAVGPLRDTAASIGLPDWEIEATIRSAFSGADSKDLHTEIPDRNICSAKQFDGGAV